MWIILLDHSGSMGDPFSGKKEAAGRSKTSKAAIKLDAAKQALLEHLQGLGSPSDNALIEFTSSASVVFKGSSNDLKGIQHVLDSLQAYDGTDISVALDTAAEYERTLQNVLTVRVLVISDGLSDRERAEAAAGRLVARRVIIDLILIDPTEQGESVARAITAINGSFWSVTSPEELSEQVAIAGEQERAQAEQAAAIVGAYEKQAAAVTGKVQPEDRLAFTVGYPSVVSPGIWYSLLIYLHITGLQTQVEDMLRQRAAQFGLRAAESRMEAFSQIQRGTVLKLTPHIEGFTFNPPTPIEVTWYEDIQDVSYRLQAESRLAGHSVLGFIEVEVGPISIARIPLSIRVRAPGEPEEVPETATSMAQSYRKIFCSYSYKNRDIVEACKAAYEALAISVYLDKSSLKSGEAWNPALHQLIQDSDLFQLYWSTASRQSSNVEDEWRYALFIIGQKGEQFIRPVRWEEPLPPLPPELSHIHVASLDIDALARFTGRSINPIQETETPTTAQKAQMGQTSASLPLFATVLPILSGTVQEVIVTIREDVAQAVRFLEEVTGLRYYPAPTLLVDDYAVKSVRALNTVDLPPENSTQKDYTLALANIINSICLDFHVRNLRPQTVSYDSFPERFGSGSLLAEAQFDAVRKYCEVVGYWVENFIQQNETDVSWRQVRNELLNLNLSIFRPDLTFVDFISTFLRTVRMLLQEGLRNLGNFEFQSSYAIKPESWQLLQKEFPNLQLRVGQPRTDWIYLAGLFSEFIQVFNKITTQLTEVLSRIARLTSPTQRLFLITVPTYGIYAPPNSLATDQSLQQWALKRGIPTQFTLPQSPRVLLCLDARQRFEDQLAHEHPNDRTELAKLFQRCILIHEHFHAILALGLDNDGALAAGTHSASWQAAVPLNESLAVWMELHFARENPKLTDLVLSYIQSGTYPDWPYRGAEYIENLYQGKGIEAVLELITEMRQLPEVAQAKLDTLSNIPGK